MTTLAKVKPEPQGAEDSLGIVCSALARPLARYSKPPLEGKLIAVRLGWGSSLLTLFENKENIQRNLVLTNVLTRGQDD